MKRSAIAALLLTAACAAAPLPAPERGSGRTCSDQGLQQLVGREANAQLAAEAKRRSGAATVRWLQPDEIVTMEFRADRLSINVAHGRVTGLRCG